MHQASDHSLNGDIDNLTDPGRSTTKAPRNLVSKPVARRVTAAGKGPPGGRRKSDQYHSGAVHASYVGQPAEILVFGEQDSVVIVGKRHQFLVDRPLLKLAHCPDIVPRLPQNSNNGEITTLVRQEPHPTAYSGLTL